MPRIAVEPAADDLLSMRSFALPAQKTVHGSDDDVSFARRSSIDSDCIKPEAPGSTLEQQGKWQSRGPART